MDYSKKQKITNLVEYLKISEKEATNLLEEVFYQSKDAVINYKSRQMIAQDKRLAKVL